MTDIVERLLDRANNDDWAIRAEAAAEIERLTALKTPASRQLLNITKGCLDNAEAENKRLRAERDELKSEQINLRFRISELELRAALNEWDESAKIIREQSAREK